MLKKAILAGATGLCIISQAYATNGYFSHGTSIAEQGMGGAGVAYSSDTLAASNNPAGMVLQGDRLDIGAALFAPTRSYSVSGGPSAPVGTPCGAACPFSIGDGNQSVTSENEMFVIPQYGQNWMMNDNASIGISVYGNGGMNTEYKGGSAILGPMGTAIELPGTYGSGTTGVNLEQLFISTTYARKISDTASWGLSAIVAYQTFKATGVGNFAGFSSDPANLSNNGTDSSSGLGFRLGVQGEVAPGINLGASFQPKIDMAEFDSYAGLFADKGDFDIPSNWTVGLAWEVGENRVFLVDMQQINYEDVGAVSNPIASLTDGSCMPGPTGGTGDGCLGGSKGAGFGWKNMTVIKLGYEWQGSDDWTWRVGYSQTDQPIPDSEQLFNILAPGVIEKHVTFGFTRQLDSASDFNFALMIAPNVSQSGKNTFDPAQTVDLEMNQYELAASYSKRF